MRDFRKALDNAVLRKAEANREVVPCLVVAVGGSIFPSNRPNSVWVTELNQPESRAVVSNGGVAVTEGLPVLVAADPKSPYGRSVIGVYVDASGGSGGGTGNWQLPIHGANHQIPTESAIGIDPVYTFLPAIRPLKTLPYSGLTVLVDSLVYTYSGTRQSFPGAFVDLSSYVPAAGYVLRVLLYLDPYYNTVQVLEGTTVLNNGVTPIPYPTIPSGKVPSSYVKLEDTTTTVEYTNIDDSRDLFNVDVTASSTTNTATREGEVLYSDDGLTFTAQLPLTNSWGWMVNDDGQLLIV